jgi:hypothetical protein
MPSPTEQASPTAPSRTNDPGRAASALRKPTARSKRCLDHPFTPHFRRTKQLGAVDMIPIAAANRNPDISQCRPGRARARTAKRMSGAGSLVAGIASVLVAASFPVRISELCFRPNGA